MRQHLQRLGTDTAIYGVSTIVGRLLNFLLVPFYTNILLPEDLGIVSYVYSIIAFLNVIYAYGMESAYFKYSTSQEIGTAKQNFSVPLLSLFTSSILFSVILLTLQGSVNEALHIPAKYYNIVGYAAIIIALDAMAIIPFAALRLERKAKTFAAVKVLNILINVVLNIILLLVLKMGVAGIFISGLAASAVTLLLLIPTIVRNFSWEMNVPLLSALLTFALPYIPAGLATQAIQVIDRPIMRALTDDTTVGIYQANYRLGIFMMLIVQMFDFAWRPFYFSMAKEPNAKQLFARVLTYLVLIMTTVFLVLTLFIRDFVALRLFGHHIIHQSYWTGLNVVPVVLLGYLFLGISNTVSAGVYIEKKTKYLPMITFIGAVVNIVANYMLIPSIGIIGGAWATLLAYLIMAVVLYIVAQRVYPMKYEFGRLGKISFAAGIVIALYFIVPLATLGSLFAIAIKLGLIIVFFLLIVGMRFFEKGERAFIKQLVMNVRSVRIQSDLKNGNDIGG
jgi:O-antigen/teichoic acid export membrane protein